jgi:phenylacetate-CoA ligase
MSTPQHSPLPIDPFLWAQTWSETCAAGLNPPQIAAAQRKTRLSRLLQHARQASPLYRERCAQQHQPAALQDFEPIEKAELMRRFDHWATDREITRDSVGYFLADPRRLADAYLGKYLVWTSSGTQGEPGIFVQDAPSLAAYDALDLQRFRAPGPMATNFGVWASPPRFAFVAATGGHFAGVVSIERLRRTALSWLGPWLAPTIRTFSVQTPWPELLHELQEFAPTILITYPSAADAVAQAQAEGLVRLVLQEVWLGGEQLTNGQRQHLKGVFQCRMRNNYGASEFYSMASECTHQKLHLNDDWVMLEPVDAQLCPVPPGVTSHSVLLTHLANHAQPLIRYRLSDSVRFVTTPCACGSRFPVIEVQGRADDTLRLLNRAGRSVALLPLALMTVLEEGAHVTQFQLLQTGPRLLELRLERGVPNPAAALAALKATLADYLRQHGLTDVLIKTNRQPPVRHPRSGKISRVVITEQPAH